jgi:CubicO group peptidase (beta-lactamase class C family)
VISDTARSTIEAEFRRQIEIGLHPAASLTVMAGGAGVFNMTHVEDGGPAAQASAGALFRVFSCGKPLVAACLWVLKERGKLSWDDPVARHWPEFAREGKGGVTVRHVLTHQAGLPTTPEDLRDRRHVADWGRCVDAMERAPLEYAPGSRVQYHSVTFGWLAGEIIARISGRSFNDFFEDHVAAPLGLRDTRFRLPARLADRVVRLKEMPGFETPGIADTYNDPRSYQVVFPAGGCISTSYDLARFYAALTGGGKVDGVPWLKPETVAEVTALAAEGVDPSNGSFQRRTLGLAMAGLAPNTYGADAGSLAFGHGGLGTSVTWGDPANGLAVAYLTSGLQPDAVNRARLRDMSAAVRRALGA